MDEKNTNNAKGGTPRKLLLIAVLAVAFVGVLIYQFGGGGATAVKSNSGEDQTAAGDGKAAVKAGAHPRPSPTNNEEKVSAPETEPEWPKISAAQAARHDPFRLPAALRATMPPKTSQQQTTRPAEGQQAQRRRQLLNSLREDGVEVVLVTGRGQIAVIGERTVRVGEVLNGFRVVSIDAQGVVLEDQADDDVD